MADSHFLSTLLLATLLLPRCAVSTCPSTLRVAAATHRDAGLQIGAHYRAMIVDRFQRSSQLPDLRRFAATPRGASALATLLASARAFNAGYVDEMHGIADGAGVARLDAELMNLRHEMGALLSGASSMSAAALFSECSDVASADFIAHNEDGFDAANNHTYILNVSVASELEEVDENATTTWWLAYCYAGELASTAFGFNSRGVAYTLNAMHCDTALEGSTVGRNFISRALLVAPSLDAASKLVVQTPSATGHNYQIYQSVARAAGPAAAPGPVLSIETFPPNRSHITTFGGGGVDDVARSAIFHANCYLFLAPPTSSTASKSAASTAALSSSSSSLSSRGGGHPWQTLRCLDTNVDSAARVNRAALLDAPYSVSSALAMLGDTFNTSYPIYANPLAPPNADGRTTLNTVLFDVRRSEARLLGGNPSNGAAAPAAVCHVWPLNN